MSIPLVSVILPVYNAELYIRESIQSILDQSFFEYELIILNDASTDNSENIILEFQDERIVYIKNDRNLKLIETLNKGLKIAKGKYIARIDADDICFSDRFQKQISFLNNNESTVKKPMTAIIMPIMILTTEANFFPGDRMINTSVT